MLLNVLLLVIFFACVACLYTEGLWGNAIGLINVVTSALLATNLFEPLAGWLERQAPTFSYVWDFLALWGLFGLFMVILRVATDLLSRVRVRFLKIADQIGGAVLSLWTAWVIVCFTAMSLHTAPLARELLRGSFQPEQRMFLGLAPDRQWLGFVQSTSLGQFSRSGTEKGKSEQTVFDPQGEFMPKYATRRASLETHLRTAGTIRLSNK
jgi:uncharacterized membrane protein required for colicin V production